MILNAVAFVCFSWLATHAGALPVNPPAVNLPDVSVQECENVMGGVVVGDIGNGAIFQPDYRCESNGEPPIGAIVRGPGEPIAIEGEVCCGLGVQEEGDKQSLNPNDSTPLDLPSSPGGSGSQLPPGTTVEFLDTQVSRQECLDQGGSVVGDIGNGAIFQPGYLCDSNGEPPIAVVVPSPGEQIAIEGEVCCGPPSQGVTEQQSSSGITVAGLVIVIVAGVVVVLAAVGAIVLYFFISSKSKAGVSETPAAKDGDSASSPEVTEAEEKV